MSNLHLELDYDGWISPHTFGKRVVCLPSIPKNATTKADIRSDDSFELGNALERQYYLLQYVFEFLEMGDLKSASLVNTFWDQLAKRESQRRTSPGWIQFLYKPKPNRLLQLSSSMGFKYNNLAVGLIIYCPDMIKLDQYVWLNKAYNFKKYSTTFEEYIGKELVPAGVDYCTIPCSKITPANSNGNFWDTVIYHGIFIPFIPKIRTSMFYFDSQETGRLSDFIKHNEEIKCVLMFTRDTVKLSESFLSAFLKGQDPKMVAMGGGLTSKTKASIKHDISRHFRTENGFCLTFLQEKGVEANFNAYSLVFNYEKYTSCESRCHAFETELVKFKKNAVLRKDGIIFKYCYFMQLSRKEVGVVEKHFTKYPVVSLGVQVDELVGMNSFNLCEKDCDTTSEDSPNPKKSKNNPPKSLHSQSIVLVLVTWGKKCYSPTV